jgi:hypothetical protein
MVIFHIRIDLKLEWHAHTFIYYIIYFNHENKLPPTCLFKQGDLICGRAIAPCANAKELESGCIFISSVHWTKYNIKLEKTFTNTFQLKIIQKLSIRVIPSNRFRAKLYDIFATKTWKFWDRLEVFVSQLSNFWWLRYFGLSERSYKIG